MKSLTEEAEHRGWSLSGEGVDTGVADRLWLVVDGRGSRGLMSNDGDRTGCFERNRKRSRMDMRLDVNGVLQGMSPQVAGDAAW